MSLVLRRGAGVGVVDAILPQFSLYPGTWLRLAEPHQIFKVPR